MQVATIGIDLAKSVFQVHGIDTAGRVVVATALRCGQVLAFFDKLRPCLVGMEACATAHRLMPPAYVRPYVRRGKNDAADAAAQSSAQWRICLLDV